MGGNRWCTPYIQNNSRKRPQLDVMRWDESETYGALAGIDHPLTDNGPYSPGRSFFGVCESRNEDVIERN